MSPSLELKYSHTLGIAAMEGRGFSNPVDLAISIDRRIYVVSRTNPLQTYGIRIGICNLDSDYFGDFGSYGSGNGAFVWPTALAFDREDTLYLADEHNNRVTIFDKSGGFLDKWGVQGQGDGQLNGPAGLAFDENDDVYVSDHLNNRVQKFTKKGGFLFSFGAKGEGEGEFNLPWGICVDADGDVFVADWRNDRIQKFSPDGRFLATIGESGQGDGQLSRPSSVTVDKNGFIYVADWGNERIQVFDAEGNFHLKLRGQATLSKWADEFYEANPDEKLERETSTLIPELTSEVDTPHEESARIEPYFWGPTSVKLDAEGRLYVTESNRHRIQIYQTVIS